MQAVSSVIRTTIPIRPASLMTRDISLTSVSEIDASSSTAPNDTGRPRPSRAAGGSHESPPTLSRAGRAG